MRFENIKRVKNFMLIKIGLHSKNQCQEIHEIHVKLKFQESSIFHLISLALKHKWNDEALQNIFNDFDVLQWSMESVKKSERKIPNFT